MPFIQTALNTLTLQVALQHFCESITCKLITYLLIVVSHLQALLLEKSRKNSCAGWLS